MKPVIDERFDIMQRSIDMIKSAKDSIPGIPPPPPATAIPPIVRERLMSGSKRSRSNDEGEYNVTENEMDDSFEEVKRKQKKKPSYANKTKTNTEKNPNTVKKDTDNKKKPFRKSTWGKGGEVACLDLLHRFLFTIVELQLKRMTLQNILEMRGSKSRKLREFLMIRPKKEVS